MGNIKSSIKDAKQSMKRKKRNASNLSTIKTYIKKVRQAIILGDKIIAMNEFKKMQKILDRYATKGLIHKNKAARHKSILYRHISNLAS
ncbi:30S ribosomal protein S20 [Buchnera aphidicola (Mollitrichosiphum nigrofasciatum)]|uniref:30S ribosomal protein S20 n=1 Tax=Buchnera aphidicola TaxID=9 RepID=UPI0031B80675